MELFFQVGQSLDQLNLALELDLLEFTQSVCCNNLSSATFSGNFDL